MKNAILIGIFSLLLSSCGVLTQTRYGNGIKLNLEWGLFSKQKVDSAYLKKYHKPRENRTSTAATIEDHTHILKPEKMQSIPKDFLFPSNIIEAPKQQCIANGFTKKEFTPKPIKEFTRDSVQHASDKKGKYEKHAVLAAVFFWGGIFSIVGFPLSIVGFILAIISLRNIKREKKKGNHLRGKGLALSVIIAVSSIFLLLYILWVGNYTGLFSF